MKNNQGINVQATFTIPFTQIQNSVIESPYFKQPIDKMVYITLIKFAFNKGHAFPSIKTISVMQNVSENTVRQSIKRLETMKLVKTEARLTKTKKRLSNLYRIYDLDYKFTIEHYNETNEFNDEEIPLQNLKATTSESEEIPLQNLKVTPSESEEEEYKLNNINLKNTNINNTKENLSIIVEKTELHLSTQKRLLKQDMIDRLILFSDKFSMKLENLLQDIEDLYADFKDNLTIDQFNSCLVDCLNADISKNLKEYVRSSLNKKSELIQEKTLKAQNEPNSSEILPDWFEGRKRKESKVYSDQNDDINEILKQFKGKKVTSR